MKNYVYFKTFVDDRILEHLKKYVKEKKYLIVESRNTSYNRYGEEKNDYFYYIYHPQLFLNKIIDTKEFWERFGIYNKIKDPKHVVEVLDIIFFSPREIIVNFYFEDINLKITDYTNGYEINVCVSFYPYTKKDIIHALKNNKEKYKINEEYLKKIQNFEFLKNENEFRFYNVNSFFEGLLYDINKIKIRQKRDNQI